MRQLFLWVCLLGPLSLFAQQIETQRKVNTVYLARHYQDEKALDRIETTSTVVAGAQVAYRAGQAIVLNPKFSAMAGAVFSATIEPVAISNAYGIHLAIAPNPIGTTALIDYVLPSEGPVNLAILDVKGNIVQELVKEQQSYGAHQHSWDSSQLTTGVYFCLLHVGKQQLTIRVVKE